jgi:septum formation protein
MTELILASTSIYRRELLARLGLPFQALPPQFDEDAQKTHGLAPQTLAESLAAGKARSLSSHQNCVIGGDQLISFNGQILGKPKTVERASEQLAMMSGHTHELITAVMIIHQGREIQHTDRTRLKMRTLTRAQIDQYVKAELPLDCSGSYKIEARGITLFEKIDSEDFTAIQGLPLLWITKILSSVGYPL